MGKKLHDYYEGSPHSEDYKMKDGYFSSGSPMGGYEEVNQVKIPGQIRGGGRDGMQRDSDRTVYIYKKDKMPEPTQAPQAPVEPIVNEAPAPEPKPTPKTSSQVKQAQSLVDSYKSNIMNGGSVYGSPNDIAEASPFETPGESFLKNKKLYLGAGLNLR